MPFDLSNYEPVEDRIRGFWEDHPSGRINTEMVHVGADGYIVKASVWIDDHPEPVATGYAQEAVTERGVNATSALENCETSAIGRALANLGYAAKGKRPSREEMRKASATVEPGTVPTGGSASGVGEADAEGLGGSDAYGEGATGPPSNSEVTLAPADDTAVLRGTKGDVQTPSSAKGSPISPEQEAKDFRDYLAKRYGTDQALLMARHLFQTAARKVPNLRSCNLEELVRIDEELKRTEEAIAVLGANA